MTVIGVSVLYKMPYPLQILFTSLTVDSVAKISSMHLAFTASTTQVPKICNVYRTQACPHRSSPNQNLNLNHCACCCRQPFIFTKNEHVLFFLGSCSMVVGHMSQLGEHAHTMVQFGQIQ